MNGWLLPGANGSRVLDALRKIDQQLGELQAGGTGPHAQFERYFQWATESATRLRMLLSEKAIAGLVLTPMLYAILNVGPPGQTAAGMRLLAVEIESRRTVLQRAIDELRKQLSRWSEEELLVVLDTNVFVHGAKKLEDIDWNSLVGRDEPIRLLVPMLVVDELDRLKQSKQPDVRGRATYTLAVLARCLAGPELQGWLHPPETQGPGSRNHVSIEVVPDPNGHVRLPLPDDEIIDRALTIHRIAGQDVHLVTCDTGMQMRARPTGLKVHEALSRDRSVESTTHQPKTPER